MHLPSESESSYAPLGKTLVMTYGSSHFASNFPFILLVMTTGRLTVRTKSPTEKDQYLTFLLKEPAT